MKKRGRPAKATPKKPVKNDSTKPVEPPKETILTLDTVAEHFSENMPKVEPYVMALANPTEAENPPTVTQPDETTPPLADSKKPVIGPINQYDYKDRYKRPFSPAIHETNPDGSPNLTRNGNLRLKAIKTPGAERLQAHAIGAKPPEVQIAEKEQAVAKLEAEKKAIAAAESLQQTKNCAFMAVMSFTGVAQGIFGDEWKPGESEMDMLTQSTTDYFHAQGITDITPGWALVLGIGAYALPRLTMPKTKAKIEGAIKAVMGPPTPKPTKLHLVPDAQNQPIPTREQFEAAQKAAAEATTPPEEPKERHGWLGTGEV
ncbi:MAG: hypothetical protein QE263_04600 [Vampirovibrionales bacterium]|nr:hypothetical protein [Vampirovibrionales bacterium]